MNAPFQAAPALSLQLASRSSTRSRFRLCLCQLNHSKKNELMRQAIFGDITPSTVIEWLLATSVVEFILGIPATGYYCWIYRGKTIEEALRHIGLAELPPKNCCALPDLTKRPDLEATAACEIDVRL